MEQLIVNPNGQVTRLFRCECGLPLYKKNLTTSQYIIRSRNAGKVADITLKGGNYCEIRCPNCPLLHKILDVKERMSLSETLTTDVI